MVVIQETHARTLRFDDHALLASSGDVAPARQPGLRSHILKDNRASFHISARCDGTMLIVERGLLRFAGRHSPGCWAEGAGVEETCARSARTPHSAAMKTGKHLNT